jgi:hypothetical protein
MDHQIAGSQTGGFRDEIIRSSPGMTWPHDAIAEDVLLALTIATSSVSSPDSIEYPQRDGRLGHSQRLGPVGHW